MEYTLINGKQAKRLRRQARGPLGRPWVDIQITPIVADTLFKKSTGSVMLEHSPRSGRGIYLSLKKEHKNGSR